MVSKAIDTIVFDLGGVLIDWQPAYVFLKEFRGNQNKMNHFLDTICAWEWNLNQDAGYPIADATRERIALYPEYERLIKMYYGRWEEMLGQAHKDTLAILSFLKHSTDYRLLALTNWSHETFPVAQKNSHGLSGSRVLWSVYRKRIRKPDPRDIHSPDRTISDSSQSSCFYRR